MPTEILPIAATAAPSADVVVASALTVSLKDAGGPDIATGALVRVQLKGDNNEYFTIDVLTSEKPALVITGPGTYRFQRAAGTACGVFSG